MFASREDDHGQDYEVHGHELPPAPVKLAKKPVPVLYVPGLSIGVLTQLVGVMVEVAPSPAIEGPPSCVDFEAHPVASTSKPPPPSRASACRSISPSPQAAFSFQARSSYSAARSQGDIHPPCGPKLTAGAAGGVRFGVVPGFGVVLSYSGFFSGSSR